VTVSQFKKGDVTMKIKEIMTKDPAVAVPESKLEEIARLMVQKDCGAIPVVDNPENMKPVGIVTDRDITCRSLANGKDPMALTAKDVMTTTLLTLEPDATLEECCDLMEEKQVRRMVVVNDRGSCVGIVAQADIARTAPYYETVALIKDVSRDPYARP
jgi:CBS domain-containing protein